MTTYKTNKKLTVLAALICIAGCGGSGGGDSAEFAGVWNGGASLVEDSCGVITEFQQFISFTHLVNQDGERVVLDNGAISFGGRVTGDSSFSADTSRSTTVLSGVSGCTETITWRYEQVKRNEAPFVVRDSAISCDGGVSCKFTFTGSAYRAGGGGGPISIDGIGDGTLPETTEGGSSDSSTSNTVDESTL